MIYNTVDRRLSDVQTISIFSYFRFVTAAAVSWHPKTYRHRIVFIAPWVIKVGLHQ